MTDKRFTYENNKVKDNLTGEFHSSNMVSVNVLNELNEEVLDLTEECSRHVADKIKDYEQFKECVDTCKRLQEENIDYAGKNHKLIGDKMTQYMELKKWRNNCEKLHKENQQIKDVIMETYNNERTAMGKSVLKQVIENIDMI